ncbi:MAG: acetate--CoA ligase [Firmicutes bacterium]|nr:acetate--CoA ligase [Bacillota bacterium]
MSKLFAPGSIAVIGASQNPGKVGYAIVKNLLESGYPGKIYPVNPREKKILGLKCFQSVKDIPPSGKNGESVDLAVIAIPAARVLEAARECAHSNIGFLIVVSAGFKEVGSEGFELEKELAAFCRQKNIRLLGPNCVGLIHTHTPVNASFARGFPQKGHISFISQSGAMLVSIIDWSEIAGLGFSHFVSMGNKADLHETDFLEYAGGDPSTKVILYYLEDIVDGQKFLEKARFISAVKPIIVLKAGASPAGARAVTSHTGALAGSDDAYNAAFRQSGVLRVDNMEELFDMAFAFVNQPLPKGNRIAIVTNSGGPAILTTDQLEKAGLQMARFSPETSKELRSYLPPEASIYNPVDVLGDATAERYKFALEKVLQDSEVDGVITLLCPTATTDTTHIARAVLEVRKQYHQKPLLGVFMGGKEIQEGQALLKEAGIPCYLFPERAVAAMDGMIKYYKNATEIRQKIALQKSDPRKWEPDKTEELYDTAPVKAAFYDALRERRLVLLGHEGARVLSAFNIPAAPSRLAREPREATRIAEEIGFPIVLKIASPKILHKSDIGGVVTGLANTSEVEKHFKEIMLRAQRVTPDASFYGIEVQKMMPPGMEVIIGSSYDVQFGHLLVFGLGGIYVNLFEDVSLRLAQNLEEADIEEMIRETKAYHLLRGFRGSSPLDVPSLKEAILNAARLVTIFPEIREMDINPLLVYEKGVCAVDVKITLSHIFMNDTHPISEHEELLAGQFAERRI